MTGKSPPLRIGLSCGFYHHDPKRPMFKGKTLFYMEEELCQWLMSKGALPYLIPRPCGPVSMQALLGVFDGIVMTGGDDVAPETYGEKPLRPEWAGDRARDLYDIEIIKTAMAANIPIYGVCRGLQVINVALGGTLYQDIRTQVPTSGKHRDWELYDRSFHEIEIIAGSGLAKTFSGTARGKVNSVHHQGIKDLADDLVIEARAVDDGIVEAVRFADQSGAAPYVFAVQWHPEWHRGDDGGVISGEPILREFLQQAAARQRR